MYFNIIYIYIYIIVPRYSQNKYCFHFGHVSKHPEVKSIEICNRKRIFSNLDKNNYGKAEIITIKVSIFPFRYIYIYIYIYIYMYIKIYMIYLLL